jgi:hypothetical protein
MRYLAGFVVVVAVVVLPPSTSAQAGEESATAEPNLQEPAPLSEPAPEEPALQLKLDDAGVGLAPTTRGSDYRKTQLRRARIGLAGSVIAFGGGVAMMGVGFANVEWGSNVVCFDPCQQTPAWARTLSILGPLLTIGGLVGMILTSKRLAQQKTELRWYAGAPESRYGKPRRVQWDLARSRLVF